jgi:hypothetical protein
MGATMARRRLKAEKAKKEAAKAKDKEKLAEKVKKTSTKKEV